MKGSKHYEHLTFAASTADLSTNSGRCTREHVGVKLPGTPTGTPFRCPNSWRIENDLMLP